MKDDHFTNAGSSQFVATQRHLTQVRVADRTSGKTSELDVQQKLRVGDMAAHAGQRGPLLRVDDIAYGVTAHVSSQSDK
jgi:hypothetical protein